MASPPPSATSSSARCVDAEAIQFLPMNHVGADAPGLGVLLGDVDDPAQPCGHGSPGLTTPGEIHRRLRAARRPGGHRRTRRGSAGGDRVARRTVVPRHRGGDVRRRIREPRSPRSATTNPCGGGCRRQSVTTSMPRAAAPWDSVVDADGALIGYERTLRVRCIGVPRHPRREHPPADHHAGRAAERALDGPVTR